MSILMLMLAAVMGAEPAAPVAPPSASFIDNPVWIRRPSAEDATSLYPVDALRLERAGRVVMACDVGADGTLTACEIIEETPVSFGFGQAALKLSGLFQMEPRTPYGRPVAGAKVRLRLHFNMPDPGPAKRPPPDLTTPLSFDEAVMCHSTFSREMVYLHDRSRIPLRSVAEALAIELGGAQGISKRGVRARLKADEEGRRPDNLDDRRCELIKP